MNYETLLNREDRRCYLLLKHLEECIDLSETNLQIQEELGLSSFLLKKTYNQLLLDLERFSLSESLNLSDSDNEIMLKIKGDYSSKVLLASYLGESLSLKILLSFFRKDFQSMEDFSFENHVSYSVAYGTLQGLKKELNPYQIFFDKGEIIGNQVNISLFLSNLFAFVSLSKEELYAKESIQSAIDLMKIFVKNYPLSEFERKQLFHYLVVFAERDTYLERESYVESLSLFTPACLSHIHGIFKNQSDTFVANMIFWLYIHGKLEPEYLNLEYSDAITELNDSFIHELTQQFLQVDPEIQEELRISLAQIHFNICHHPMSLFEDFEIDVLFFKQNYTEFYFFLLKEVNQITKGRPELEKGKVFLFFSYLMLLINHVPLRVINEPIKVLVDFSYGVEYNRFIMKNLTFYVNLNIVFLQSDSEVEPDIVITNINDLYSSPDIFTTVWLDPPRTVDWITLTNNLLEIKENKFNNK